MKLLINLENTDDFREFEFSEADTLETLKYIFEAEYLIQFIEQQIIHNGSILTNDHESLQNLNFRENDIIILRKNIKTQNLNLSANIPTTNTNNFSDLGSVFDNTMKILKNNKNIPSSNQNNFGFNRNPIEFSNFSQNQRVKAEMKNIKDLYLNNPDQLNYLFTTDQKLAEMIVSGDENKLEELIKSRINEIDKKKQQEYSQYLKLANSDPNDHDAQLKIEEMIKMKNIEENLTMAQEYLPESFGHINMLFINIEINKCKMVGLVDTGAQTTIISEDLARKCGLFNLCDTRFHGIAKGVGVSKIVGVIHAAQIKVGDRFIMCKLTVIENNSIGFIFGLDNMRSHRCFIDLGKDTLNFPDSNIQVSFLTDGEVKKTKVDEEYDEITNAELESMQNKNMK